MYPCKSITQFRSLLFRKKRGKPLETGVALGKISVDGIALISLRREMCFPLPSFPSFSFFFRFILRIRCTIYVDNCAGNEKIAAWRVNVFRAARRSAVLKRQRDIDVIVKKINFNEINSRRSARGANKIPLIGLQWDV